MARALVDAGIVAISQYAIWHYTLDFALPGEMLAIECDGDYWHSLAASIKRDQRKYQYLSSLGWRVLRLSESEIKNDIDECLARIKQALSTE